jgi:hypothetical protein
MEFATAKALIQEILPPFWDDQDVEIWPGPDDPDQPVDLNIVCTIDGGLGLQLDGALDNISWQFKVFGNQNLYEDAEKLANDLDFALMSFAGHRVNGQLIVSIYRVGGRPAHFQVDDAERTQFVCSYYFDVESGLPPI